ncbi:hypothetical protein D9V84_10455 [Bacteroidetes/Chlorobi group bacterium Naka2016]|nr:MAG: hypothetical protein D9V84_10455 [Bacteroidetes/Chlorobi group bacterium Naka2016]
MKKALKKKKNIAQNNKEEKMGAIPKEMIEKEKIQFVRIDKDNGGFTYNEENFPGFEGIFLGFNSHTYDFKGKTQHKIDIFLYDEYVYMIEIGRYSWIAFKLLNQLLSIPTQEIATSNNHMRLLLTKRGDNLNIFVRWNGEFLRWKYKFADLKFNDKNEAEKQQHLKKIIDKWFNVLFELKPFDPKKDIETIKETEEIENEAIKIVDDEDLPF